MKKYVFGIDLGTTYSCISYVDDTGRPVVVNNFEGTNTTPSVVNFASPTKVVVGQVAKETAVIDPHNTVAFVKRLMGKTNFAIHYNGEDKSPEEVSAYILRKVAEDAGRNLNCEVKEVVITCPAYFGFAERMATKQAGEIAGLKVLEVIDEPVAAAIYYGMTKEHGKKTILVYDLGGGTFDVTIMNIDNGKIEMVCKDGNHELGGKDWDDAVINYLVNRFIEETNYEGDLDDHAKQDLQIKAEKAKQQLTFRDETPVVLDVAGLRTRIMLSRETFDEITSGLLNMTLEKTDAAIAVAREKGFETIDEILLVGGSTRMPQISKALKEKYGIEPKLLDPDEAVAKGAAIYALTLYANSEEREEEAVQLPVLPGNPPKIVMVTSKSYALRVIVGEELKCVNMIVKNMSMPEGAVTVSRKFGTHVDNQETADLIVYESDIMDEYFEVDDKLILGQVSLELPGNLPKSSPIEVTFTLDSEGFLHVHGKDLTGNREIRTTLQTSAGIMSREQMEQLKQKSKEIIVE